MNKGASDRSDCNCILCRLDRKYHGVSPGSKPPPGVMPEWLWLESRIDDLRRAIDDYEELYDTQGLLGCVLKWKAELSRLLGGEMRRRKRRVGEFKTGKGIEPCRNNGNEMCLVGYRFGEDYLQFDGDYLQMVEPYFEDEVYCADYRLRYSSVYPNASRLSMLDVKFNFCPFCGKEFYHSVKAKGEGVKR